MVLVSCVSIQYSNGEFQDFYSKIVELTRDATIQIHDDWKEDSCAATFRERFGPNELVVCGSVCFASVHILQEIPFLRRGCSWITIMEQIVLLAQAWVCQQVLQLRHEVMACHLHDGVRVGQMHVVLIWEAILHVVPFHQKIVKSVTGHSFFGI